MEKILIIDFGSQVTQLIARRVRESKVYCEIHPYKKINTEFLDKFTPKGIILSGGPSSVTQGHSPRIGKHVLEYGVPVLGICYGQQLMCDLLGAKVESSNHREFGRAFVEVVDNSKLFEGLWTDGDAYRVWMSHGDRVDSLPQGFKVIAKSEGAPFAAIANEEKHLYGVQFHPEVTHTPDGAKLIANFINKICGCDKNWDMHNFLSMAVEKIRKQVGSDKVICGVSGGVDSTVVAALIHKAIGDNLTCIFVDLGLLRKNEREEVETRFKERFHIPIKVVDASDMFLKKIAGVTDPEQKRKIIGASFIEVFEAEAAKVQGARFLAQGTLYPDVIESVSVHGDAAVTIKSHHNVGGLPELMKLELVEPVRELFKDEVRELGRELGMDDELITRHPFPGPGLAIRIPGEITLEKIKILQEADAIYIDEIKKAGLYNEIWQAFAVLLPVKTVGVMGDARTYEYVCALRAVTSTDGMTADFYDFSHEFLRNVSTRIINNVKGINRIVYDITSKPPGTIEWSREMAILVTGAAGFIGFHVAKELLTNGEKVIGIDNLNDYYDVSLKEARLKILNENKDFLFYPSDIADKNDIFGIGNSHPEIKYIVHLAAQAGVRYSLENPFAYVSSNLVGQVVMLELCRNLPNLEHFIYASSSSVYGGNTKLPFSVNDNVDRPLSLYAATKKSDELLTHSYSHLFGIQSTGLRFFTVYGPWGRPDMATYSFARDILAGKAITVFNNGDMKRDFTYIDDIVSGIIQIIYKGLRQEKSEKYKVYNLGNNRSENLMDFIHILENCLGKKAIINFAPMHPGDVKETYADIEDTKHDFGFYPKTSIEEGLPKFVEWYKGYYG